MSKKSQYNDNSMKSSDDMHIKLYKNTFSNMMLRRTETV